ncbi:hypothetical protein JCM11641_008073 [Rhodosporidiobolus odoratus]
MPSEARWLVVYGPHLYPPRLEAHLRNIHPLVSSTVTVQDAYLSFDVPGIPFLEPVYANSIVRGVNDGHGGRKEGGEEYNRWIWERCCPGMAFEGELPPNLEGIAYKLAPSDYAALLSSLQSASPSEPSMLVPVRCTKFADGDSSRPLGDIEADLFILNPGTRPAGLQPTLAQLSLIVRGAFLNALSRPYLAHLTLMRPYAPSTPSKLYTRTLIRLILLPSFLIFHLPSTLLGLPMWARIGKVLSGDGWGKMTVLERLFRGIVGSGWLNEADHEAAKQVKGVARR